MQTSAGNADSEEDGRLTSSMGNLQAIKEMDWMDLMGEEEAAAATKIQATVRGFSVRRRKPLIHLRKISSVRQELSELQTKAADPVYIERICVDVVECRKLQEGIMALLLRLDALQGVHPVVRDIRKSVNREVVQFMEVIDAVVVGAPSSPWQDGRNNPHMGRSNSISHLDRVSNHSLKRMHSLDNCTYPQQSCKRQQDKGLKFEQYEEDEGMVSQPEGEVHSSHSPLSSQEGDTGKGNSGPKGMHHHSELESLRTLTAVVIIQSFFRGYSVRRSRPLKQLRNIADVSARLRELTDEVSNPNNQSKLRFDKMERLKVTECITALLLQLDSVQGVDQVVRDIRKSVTREVFKLQELVDTLISNPQIVKGDLALPCNDVESESDGSLSDTQQLDNYKTDKYNPAADGVAFDSLSLNSTSCGRVDDEIGPSTPECEQPRNDMCLDDVSSDPSTEENCVVRDRNHLQVRMSDGSDFSSCESEAKPVAANSPDSSGSEAEGNELHDQELRMSSNAHATSAEQRVPLSYVPSFSTTTQFDGYARSGPTTALGENKIPALGMTIRARDEDTMHALADASCGENLPASGSKDEAMFGREEHDGGVGSMHDIGQLAEENARLRAFLNRVLNFVEVQSSMVSSVTGTNEKLEADNVRLKKREEVWRKKSKRARRRG